MLEIVPQNSEEWTLVKEMHSQKYPDHERDEMSIKRQFTKMHRKKQPTGDPHMRDHIRIAKKAFHEIGSCALISDGTNNFEVLEIPVIERTQTQTLEPTFEPTLGQSTQLTDVQPSFDDSDEEEEEEDLEAGDLPAPEACDLPAPAVRGRNTGVNTTAIVHRPSPPSRGRRNNNSTMQESVVQMMMMDMQQRQQEQQQRQQEHQDRMEQMERERIESRLLMSQAIDSMAKAFAIYQNNNSN